MRKPGAMCLAFHHGAQKNHVQSVSAIETRLEGPICLFMLFFISNFVFIGFTDFISFLLLFIVICLRPFTDLRDVAAWRPTENMALFCFIFSLVSLLLFSSYFVLFSFSDLAFVLYQQRLRQPLHPLAASHYFCARWFFFLDLMHLMDCKGVTAIVAGSVLGILVRRPALGANKAERLVTINQHRADWYAAHPRSFFLLEP